MHPLQPLSLIFSRELLINGMTAQHAFDELKTAMSSTPVLALPDFDKKFVLETDASNLGIGAVLMQQEQPLSYFSKKLSLRMQQASAYVREL